MLCREALDTPFEEILERLDIAHVHLLAHVGFHRALDLGGVGRDEIAHHLIHHRRRVGIAFDDIAPGAAPVLGPAVVELSLAADLGGDGEVLVRTRHFQLANHAGGQAGKLVGFAVGINQNRPFLFRQRGFVFSLNLVGKTRLGAGAGTPLGGDLDLVLDLLIRARLCRGKTLLTGAHILGRLDDRLLDAIDIHRFCPAGGRASLPSSEARDFRAPQGNCNTPFAR